MLPRRMECSSWKAGDLRFTIEGFDHFFSQQRDDLVRFHHLTVGFERGEEGFVNVFGWDGCVAVGQVACRAGVFGDDDFEAEIGGGAGGGIHAHVSHHAGDDHALDAPLLQHLQQVRLAE